MYFYFRYYLALNREFQEKLYREEYINNHQLKLVDYLTLYALNLKTLEVTGHDELTTKLRNCLYSMNRWLDYLRKKEFEINTMYIYIIYPIYIYIVIQSITKVSFYHSKKGMMQTQI